MAESIQRREENPDIWKLMMSSAKGISKVSGLPIANTMRTFESLYNFFSPDNLGREASSTEYRKLYNSIAEGKYQRQYDKLIKRVIPRSSSRTVLRIIW